MNSHAIKIIRWILLVPLTFAVLALVIYFVDVVPRYFSAHVILHSFWGLALVVQAFIPGFLVVPTTSAIAPSHRKKTSIITLVSVACLWSVFAVVMVSLQPPLDLKNTVFPIIGVCAPLLGLAAGFAAVRFALKKHEGGGPFFMRLVIIVVAVVCITAIPLHFFGKRDGSAVLLELQMNEQGGVVTCVFTLKNKSDWDNAVSVELIAVRGHTRNPGYPTYTPEILAAAAKSTEKTCVNMILPPKNISTGLGQFTLDANAKGPFILVARLIYRID